MPTPVSPSKHRFTTQIFHQIQTLGFLAENQRYELIEGEIIARPLLSANHANQTLKMLNHLTRCIDGKTLVNMHNAVNLGDYAEVIPDLCLLTLNTHYYQQNLPKAEDILLVVELVDEQSSAYIRKVKMPLYARHGISEAWLIDSEQQFIDVGRVPAAQGYTQIKRYQLKDVIYPQLMPNVAIKVNYLF